MSNEAKSIRIVDTENLIKTLNNKFENIDSVYKVFEEVVGSNKWTSIPNKNLYFNKEIMACYPNFLNNFQDIELNSDEMYEEVLEIIKSNEEYSKYGIEWDMQTYNESINSFYIESHPMQSDSNRGIGDCYRFLYCNNTQIQVYNNNSGYFIDWGNGLLIPIYRLGDKKDYKSFEKDETHTLSYSIERIFKIFLEENLIIDKIYNDNNLKEDFINLESILFQYNDFIDRFEEKNNKIEIIWNIEKIQREILDNEDKNKLFKNCKLDIIYNDEEKKDRTKLYEVLNVDKIRVNLDEYDENILIDPNRGYWELLENKDEIEKTLGKKVYERDPRLDIKKGGIVGIDFGTKSTIVVYQDDRNITLPMRISGGILNKEVENNDFENPTVIEFINIERFMNDYRSEEGRPLTKWEDVTVSHTAFKNLINGTSAQFSSTISDLKQWAGSRKYSIVVKDKQNIEKVFKPYLELTKDDIDPIELYAYYIGSYINNMRNGIYLEYFLSFPVTYEKAIREKILESFKKGIKKSLPKTILEDESIMKKFKVKHGANEPAAYSACALQEYGFEPEDEEVYYGVFDFGGGTLDFDFGIWRASEDERSYDYELEHFGAGGDRYLGGENILKEMAFEVFKENKEVFRKEKISFIRPEWCDKFIGDENLVDESQEAKLNMRLLMEKLRGIWEENNDKNNSEEVIKFMFFDKNGELKTGIELAINRESLEDLIEKKIGGGIENFFIALDRAFKNEEYDKLYVMLAGNSCKHPLVMKKFKDTIQEKGINAEILPALGTEEAYLKLEERGIAIDKDDKTKPTGKTGVAYGIISSRTGGRIKVINRDENKNENNEINFKYYIGYEGRKKFKPILTPQTEYNSFVYLLNATSDVFDLYYSTLPEASEGKMLIEKAKKERVSLNKEYDDGEKIYIRALSPDTIEYVITKVDITEKNYLEQGKITLN